MIERCATWPKDFNLARAAFLAKEEDSDMDSMAAEVTWYGVPWYGIGRAYHRAGFSFSLSHTSRLSSTTRCMEIMDNKQ